MLGRGVYNSPPKNPLQEVSIEASDGGGERGNPSLTWIVAIDDDAKCDITFLPVLILDIISLCVKSS